MILRQMRINMFGALAIWVLGWGQAWAVQLQIDLNDGSFSPGLYFSGDFSLEGPITVGPDQPAEIWVDFVDATNGAKQHLEVFGSNNSGNAETLSVALKGGNVTVPAATVNFTVELSGVSGDLSQNPLGIDGVVCDPSVGGGCFSGALPSGGDLTDTSFFFHDLHINMAVTTGETFDVNLGNFLIFADGFEIGTWPVPEPATLVLFGAGLAGLNLVSRREKKTGKAKAG